MPFFRLSSDEEVFPLQIQENKKKSAKVGQIIKKIIKSIPGAIALFVFTFLIIRVIMSEIDVGMSTRLLWDDTAKSVYYSAPSEFEVYDVSGLEYLTMDGYFHVSNVRYLEASGQLEATVRYNDSIIKTMHEVYDHESDPECEPFVFELCDKYGAVISSEYFFSAEHKMMYNYRKLSFSGVNIEWDTELFIKVYYINDAYKADSELSSLVVYTPNYELVRIEDLRKLIPSDSKSRIYTYGADRARDGKYTAID